jgi:hypothetical protein
MKMMRTLIFISCLLPAFCYGQVLSISQSQKDKVSGYLGNKNIIQIKGMYALSKEPQRAMETTADVGFAGVTINKEYEINIDRVITNRKSIGLVLGTAKTSMLFNDPQEYVAMEGGSLSRVDGTPAITDKYLGMKYKIYNRRKGGLSPVGRYWAFNAGIHNYKIDMTELDFMVYKESPSGFILVPYKLKEGVHKYKLAEFGIATGVNRIIAQRVILDYGAQFSFVKFGQAFIARYQDSNGSNLTSDDYIKSSILSRISHFHIMKFYFSAGYIF